MTRAFDKGQTRAAKGFTKPSEAEFRREATRADYNDRGQSNVSVLDESYLVTEEKRYFDDDNTSLQNVQLYIGPSNKYRSPGWKEPGAELISNRNGEVASLVGQADGDVHLDLHREGKPRISLDITDVAASAGITAAGIRRTQQDIAADGEVSRPEQQQIINLIDRAKAAAGIR